jgi:hypothetical protein
VRYLRTAAAAQHCRDLGRPTSPHTLRKLRQKGPDDPGDQGPPWVRDPATEHCMYPVEGLDAWVHQWEKRLKATRVPKLARLCDEAV